MTTPDQPRYLPGSLMAPPAAERAVPFHERSIPERRIVLDHYTKQHNALFVAVINGDRSKAKVLAQELDEYRDWICGAEASQ